MFYEECVIGGILYGRGTPDGEWKPVLGSYKAAAIKALSLLSAEERVEAMNWFCSYCGSRAGGACTCMRDD